MSLSSSDVVITKSQPRRKNALRNHCSKTGEYVISTTENNRDMLSMTGIKGVEIVGMPVEHQLLVPLGLSCRVPRGSICYTRLLSHLVHVLSAALDNCTPL